MIFLPFFPSIVLEKKLLFFHGCIIAMLMLSVRFVGQQLQIRILYHIILLLPHLLGLLDLYLLSLWHRKAVIRIVSATHDLALIS